MNKRLRLGKHETKTGAAFNRGASRQDYQTDPRLIAAVVARFGALEFDLAATRENSQCGEYFMGPGSKVSVNALSTTWDGLQGNLWLNPPYSEIARWAKKCSEYQGDGRIFFLVPASVGSNWFRDFVHPFAHTYILNGRLTFAGEKGPFPKDCMLCVYIRARICHEFMQREIDIWRWNP